MKPALQHIVDAIGLAYRWHNGLIKSGLQIREYAIEHQLNRTRILNLLPLTLLSPKILGNALAGTLPSRITLGDLLTASKQLDWNRQATELGINTTMSQISTAQSANCFPARSPFTLHEDIPHIAPRDTRLILGGYWLMWSIRIIPETRQTA